jgi:hypothetical protein
MSTVTTISPLFKRSRRMKYPYIRPCYNLSLGNLSTRFSSQPETYSLWIYKEGTLVPPLALEVSSSCSSTSLGKQKSRSELLNLSGKFVIRGHDIDGACLCNERQKQVHTSFWSDSDSSGWVCCVSFSYHNITEIANKLENYLFFPFFFWKSKYCKIISFLKFFLV